MIIYEVVQKGNPHIYFRTKDIAKAQAFADVYNRYHPPYFDDGVQVRSFDTNSVDRAADSFIKKFRFMKAVQTKDGKVLSTATYFIDPAWTHFIDSLNALSDAHTSFADI